MTDTNFRALCAELLKALEYEAGTSDDWAMLRVKAGAALAQPEPTLTVEDCSNMHKHRFNFLDEDRFGEIVLDGCFTREDLIEITNTVPTTEA